MTEFKISVQDVMSASEIKKIVEDEIRASVRHEILEENNIRRIISNSTYTTVYKMVDDSLDEDLTGLIKTKVTDIIKTLNSYCIFEKPDAWSTESNTAYKIMRATVSKNKQLIEDLTLKAIKEQVPDVLAKELSDNIEDTIHESVMNVIRGSK